MNYGDPVPLLPSCESLLGTGGYHHIGNGGFSLYQRELEPRGVSRGYGPQHFDFTPLQNCKPESHKLDADGPMSYRLRMVNAQLSAPADPVVGASRNATADATAAAAAEAECKTVPGTEVAIPTDLDGLAELGSQAVDAAGSNQALEDAINTGMPEFSSGEFGFGSGDFGSGDGTLEGTTVPLNLEGSPTRRAHRRRLAAAFAMFQSPSALLAALTWAVDTGLADSANLVLPARAALATAFAPGGLMDQCLPSFLEELAVAVPLEGGAAPSPTI